MINWGKIWTTNHSKELRHIRVKTEVSGKSIANAYNGKLWLRRVLLGDISDGLYTLTINGGLRLAEKQNLQKN